MSAKLCGIHGDIRLLVCIHLIIAVLPQHQIVLAGLVLHHPSQGHSKLGAVELTHVHAGQNGKHTRLQGRYKKHRALPLMIGVITVSSLVQLHVTFVVQQHR